MAVYSEIISNDKILSLMPPSAHSILIVACGGCVNESLAFKNGCQIFDFNGDIKI